MQIDEKKARKCKIGKRRSLSDLPSSPPMTVSNDDDGASTIDMPSMVLQNMKGHLPFVRTIQSRRTRLPSGAV